jgi:23S rRNA pseudouridine2457 synthase
MYRYFAIYKPYQMLSQFTREAGHQSLADLAFSFPKDIYPLGRLDADSEGLLLLSNDPRVNKQLLSPATEHWRTYFVQVEGEVDDDAIDRLSKGIDITVDGKKYKTKPCKAEKITQPEFLPERNPPVRFRKNIPTSWLKISLIEGKNRQVRKMTAAVNFPTLRLIRISIENLTFDKFDSGTVIEIAKAEFYQKLHLRP